METSWKCLCSPNKRKASLLQKVGYIKSNFNLKNDHINTNSYLFHIDYCCISYIIRLKSEALHQRVECEIITDLEKLQEICPLIRVDDLVGGLWVPTDGVANPFEICRALSALSQEMGVR